jgi:two-component system OmpR family sensor kinase
MASLRARLLAAVLALTAVALLVLAVITYAEQRSFQFDRLDSQVRAAPPAVAGALARQGVGPAVRDRDHDHDHRRGPPGPTESVPFGTYGERRTRRAARSARRSSSTTART